MENRTLLDKVQKLRKFDLNLLVVFEVVYVCKSGVKAAQILNVTPPAISQSLVRLRNYFADALFVRQGSGLTPTTMAVNLHQQLQGAFEQLLNSLNYFSDEETKKKFIIYCSPYSAIRILPFIVKQIELNGIRCEITHISSDAMISSIDDVLTYRKADIVLDTHPYYSFATQSDPYLTDHAVAICRKDHPRLGDTLSKEEMKKEKSTFLKIHSDMVKKNQININDFFGEREINFSSSSVISVASVVEYTDGVSFIPEWFAHKILKSFNIKILTSDFTPQPVTSYITYNKTSLRDKEFSDLIGFFQLYAANEKAG